VGTDTGEATGRTPRLLIGLGLLVLLHLGGARWAHRPARVPVDFTETEGDKHTVELTTFRADPLAGVNPCVQVRTISSGRASEPATDCAG